MELNADVGELPGDAGRASDREILTVVNTANIACGAHAGDDAVMRATLEICVELGVTAAAHPGYPDRAGFGRRRGTLTPAQIQESVREQILVLVSHAGALDLVLSRVKAHGALYNEAMGERETAEALLLGIEGALPKCAVVGLAGSPFLQWARAHGFRVLAEGFADRGYRADGTLVPRSEPGALVEDEEEAARRAVRMAMHGAVTAVDGSEVALSIDTLCVHGDQPGAAARAAAVRRALRAAGIALRSAP